MLPAVRAVCSLCVLMVMLLSCRFVPLTMCTNDDFSTSHQAPSACFAQNGKHDVATVIRCSARAILSSAACLLVSIGAACMLVTRAWLRLHTLCSHTFFRECTNILCMHWHGTALIVLLAVAPLAASKHASKWTPWSTLSRLWVVSRSPHTVAQASNTTKQLLSAHSATRPQSWHGVFNTLWCQEAYTFNTSLYYYSLFAVRHCACPLSRLLRRVYPCCISGCWCSICTIFPLG